jgi:hypothetical protein
MKKSGLWKALPLALIVAALSLATVSCNSSNTTTSGQAAIRVINAIPDGPALDIDINGTKTFTNLTYATAQPATDPASYLTVASGSVLVQSFATGTTTNPVPPKGTVTLKNGALYTVVAVGLEINESLPLVVADNNALPIGTNVEFRIINASNSSPVGGIDVYIVPPGTTDLTNFHPQFSGLNNNQPSGYQSLSFLAGGYDVIVTANGGKTPILTWPVAANASSITTLVIVDNAGGNNGISTTPLVLNDLN